MSNIYVLISYWLKCLRRITHWIFVFFIFCRLCACLELLKSSRSCPSITWDSLPLRTKFTETSYRVSVKALGCCVQIFHVWWFLNSLDIQWLCFRSGLMIEFLCWGKSYWYFMLKDLIIVSALLLTIINVCKMPLLYYCFVLFHVSERIFLYCTLEI